MIFGLLRRLKRNVSHYISHVLRAWKRRATNHREGAHLLPIVNVHSSEGRDKTVLEEISIKSSRPSCHHSNTLSTASSANDIFPNAHLGVSDEETLLEIPSGRSSVQLSSSASSFTSQCQSDCERHSLDKRSNHSPLRRDLASIRIEWPPQRAKYFYPAQALRRVMNPVSIFLELKRLDPESANEAEQDATSQRISATSYKLFALLVRLRLGPHIRDFLDEGVDDSHLPFVRSDRENKTEAARKFKLCSGKHPGRVVRCMIDLDDEDVERIFRAQWEVNAQVFEFSDDIKHYNLDPNSVLPWVEDHQHENSAMQGGFGSVWKVKIHPDHRIKGGNGAEPFPRFIACKELHFKDEQTFQSEVDMLQAFKKSRHAHLVKLLATFHFDGKYYLLFPCAELNLRQYWHRNPKPDFTPRTVYWMLSQCKAVADALYVVHEYRSTRDALNSHSVRRTNQSDSAPFANIDNRRYGRHGDIKPENILWFFDEIAKDRHDQGRLVIADFGLTEFHSRASRSKVPARNITGSATYEPPELLLDTTISRAYDIWSLGCVYLEFTTWLLCSPEAFSIFPRARLQTGEMEVEMEDDNFFTILKTDPPTAIIRKSVQDWIRDLHREPRCSNFIHEFLHLISDRMLEVNPKDRIVIGMLRRELQQMVDKAKTDPSYLTESTPWKLPVQNPHPLSIAGIESTDRAHAPTPSDGFPLPKRQDTSVGLYAMRPSCFSPENMLTMTESTSPPSSPQLR